MRTTASQLGWLTMTAAIVTIFVTRSVSAPTGIGLAVMTLALGGWALRQAVRSDAGIPHSLFGLAFAFIALLTALFTYGAQRGGRYSGLQQAPVVQRFSMATNSRSVGPV